MPQIENRRFTLLSPQEIIEQLQIVDPSSHETVEFQIVGDLLVSDLLGLLRLPFETSITEENGSLIVSSGSEQLAGINPELLRRRYHSRISAHVEPTSSSERSLATPSLLDAEVTAFVDRSTLQVAIQEFGITFYQRPVSNPFTKEVYLDSVHELILDYGVRCGVAMTDLLAKAIPNLKPFSALSRDQQADIQENFARQSGMILLQIPWQDSEGISQGLAYINLHQNFFDQFSGNR